MPAYRRLAAILLAAQCVLAAQALPRKDKPMHTNRLAREKSPYLLQHAHNPVDWYPWGTGGVRKSAPGKQADLPLDRLLDVPLVPCHGARII